MKIFWFRRDLRLEDNKALNEALRRDESVLPIFIFDTEIISELSKDDARLTFIYDCLKSIDSELQSYGSSLMILQGNPQDVFRDLINEYAITEVFFNKDFEPYGITRDEEVSKILAENGIGVSAHLDHIIFEPDAITKSDGKPYTVYTPFKNAWLKKFRIDDIEVSEEQESRMELFYHSETTFPNMTELGFSRSDIKVESFSLEQSSLYKEQRDVPFIKGTTRLGPHLRFGTVSLRAIIRHLNLSNEGDATLLNELIWREFFIQILFNFPHVISNNFRAKYDGIQWRNNPEDFQAWCSGKTGYPMVDAGMRELNTTGYMHNRVRMIVAGFLCKHLLIDWKWGEAYFAEKLFDFELASNNGNWQWAAGTGCDAAPYFRVFNPTTQLEKFDPDLRYVKKYVEEYGTEDYVKPIVEHKFARERALEAYKKGIMN